VRLKTAYDAPSSVRPNVSGTVTRKSFCGNPLGLSDLDRQCAPRWSPARTSARQAATPRAGQYRARYTGPDGRRYKAPTVFLSIRDARGWLSLRQSEIIRKAWTPPEATAKVTKTTFPHVRRSVAGAA